MEVSKKKAGLDVAYVQGHESVVITKHISSFPMFSVVNSWPRSVVFLIPENLCFIDISH